MRVAPHRWAPVLLLGASIAFSLSTIEIGSRTVLTHTDEYGRTWYGRVLLGRALPDSAGMAAWVSAYRSLQPGLSIVFDSMVGWAPRPCSVEDGIQFDALGSRVGSAAQAPVTDTDALVLAFGDSFTLGQEVTDEASWPRILERASGARVLNFGVGGYGMDQAFLRWEAVRTKLTPDVVLFGFQPENVLRNGNLLRPFYVRGGAMMFTKPRFLLAEESLEIVNRPTVPIEALPDLMHDPTTWPHYELDWFAPREGPDAWWHRSRGLSLLAGALRALRPGPDFERFGGPEHEAGGLAVAILESFRASVEASGAQFLVVHIPRPDDDHLGALGAGSATWYSDIWAHIEEEFKTIDVPPELEAAYRSGEALAQPGGHFNSLGNALIAGWVERSLTLPVRSNAALDLDLRTSCSDVRR